MVFNTSSQDVSWPKQLNGIQEEVLLLNTSKWVVF